MKFLSKRDNPSPKKPAEVHYRNNDTLFAVIRRLTAQVNELQRLIGDCRRDINRIERKQNREAEATKVLPQETVDSFLMEGLPWP